MSLNGIYEKRGERIADGVSRPYFEHRAPEGGAPVYLFYMEGEWEIGPEVNAIDGVARPEWPR